MNTTSSNARPARDGGAPRVPGVSPPLTPTIAGASSFPWYYNCARCDGKQPYNVPRGCSAESIERQIIRITDGLCRECYQARTLSTEEKLAQTKDRLTVLNLRGEQEG